MRKRYVVHLTGEERGDLEALVRRGWAHVRRLLYTRILLKADASEAGPAWADERIADALETSAATVARERRRFLEDGLETRVPSTGSSWSACPAWIAAGMESSWSYGTSPTAAGSRRGSSGS
ncbi:MAG TPA: hypothetical protein VFE21_13130 [Rubrobacteraceae bacterium]|nr:hypothetical protein [Rubrobacteraceae bacterium]